METIVLGGYTRKENKGIATVQLNPTTKRLENVSLAMAIASPTYLSVVGDFVFSILQEDNWAGIALLEKQANGYGLVSKVLTEDVKPPCYVSFDRTRQLVFAAYYHEGFFQVFGINEDGLVLLNEKEHEGSSVHENQTSSHVHYAKMDKQNEKLLVCDLGTDEVYRYNVLDNGTIFEHDRYQTKAGFGPRHLVEHPTLPIIYIIGELSNEIHICRCESEEWRSVDYVSTLPVGYTDWSGAAAIRLSRDGKFLYASNRGHDSIVVYRVLENGRLEVIEWVASGGKTPRDFNFNQTEDFLIVAHQDDDVLALFERDVQTGQLTLVDRSAVAKECVCVAVRE